jgi:hypothetical protein
MFTNCLPFQSINVIECPEFRQLLLLLRQDLRDQDIPSRDTVRRSIIEAWYSYYQSLKEELEVL